MKNPRPSVVLSALFTALALFLGCTPLSAQQGTSVYNSSFSIAEQSVDHNGHAVVVMQGGGDLPGVLTLVLSVASDGTVTGEWAMNVSYSAPLHPDAQPDPTATDADGAQGDQLIQKGMLKGKISSGSATLVNGQIASLKALQLVIVGGSLQFSGVTKGTGAVTAVHVDDRNTSAANLSLTF